MLRRWVDLALVHPELLADHAGTWAQFLAAEWAPAWRARRRLAALWAVAALTGSLGLMLSGVALMLAAVTPPGQLGLWPTQLALWLVPLLPLLLSGACVLAARRQGDDGAWARINRQWQADRSLWQQDATQ